MRGAASAVEERFAASPSAGHDADTEKWKLA